MPNHFDVDNVYFFLNWIPVSLFVSFLINHVSPSMTIPSMLFKWISLGYYYIYIIVHNGSLQVGNHLKQMLASWLFISLIITSTFPGMDDIKIWSLPMWIMGMVLGLHFGFLDELPLFKNFDITPSEMKLWKWPQWTIFYSIIAMFTTLTFYIIHFANSSMFWWYTLAISLIAVISKILYPTYVLHLHHYFISLFFVPMTCLRDDGLLMIVQGLLFGVYVQAVTVWGLAWIWVKNNDPPTNALKH